MLFRDVPLMAHFFDAYDDLWQKVSENTARTSCFGGCLSGFRANEQVTLTVPKTA